MSKDILFGFARLLLEVVTWMVVLMVVASWIKESVSCHTARSLGLSAFILFEHIGPVPVPVSVTVWWVDPKPVMSMALVVLSGSLAALLFYASCLLLSVRRQRLSLAIVSMALLFYSILFCPVEVYFAATVGLSHPMFIVSALITVFLSFVLTVAFVPKWFRA